MTLYSQQIKKLLGCTPREAVLTEAWMRLEHSTLDFLAPEVFGAEARESIACVRNSTDEKNVSLAQSYGLDVPCSSCEHTKGRHLQSCPKAPWR